LSRQTRGSFAANSGQNFAANQTVVYRDFAATFFEPSAEQISRQISRQTDNYLVVTGAPAEEEEEDDNVDELLILHVLNED
jgi:hypothetical protein